MLYGWQYDIIRNLEAERERWFLWVPVLFATGIGVYFLLPAEPSMWWTLVVIELTLLAVWVARHKSGVLWFLAGWGIILAGFANIQLKAVYLNKVTPVETEDKLYLTGRVAATDVNYRGNQRLILEEMRNYDGETVPGRYKLTTLSKKKQARVGDCVELVATVRPNLHPAMPGAYQLDRKAYFEGLSGGGFIASRVLPVECQNGGSLPQWFSMGVSWLRDKIVERINHVLPPEEAGIAAAIVAGERGGINQTIIENYRDSGLAHFLSISGLHMSMIAGMMFFLVRLLMAMIPPLSLKYDAKKTAALFAILMSIVYLFISGAAIPSQRAFIMTFIVLLGVLFARQAISMRMIVWAALIVLIISPQALISASFQMSFAAVAALVAFYERYASSLRRFLTGVNYRDMALPVRVLKIIWVYFIGIMVSDLVASLATLPFAVYHFNRVAVFTTITNLAAGPIIGFVIMPFVLLALLLMPLGWEYWSLKLVGSGIELVNQITAYVAGLPEAAYKVMSMPLWGLLLVVYGALWIFLWQGKWRRWGFISVAVGMLSMLMVCVPDVMADAEGEVFAVKAENGKLVILPSRGNNYLKKVWLEKTANDKLTPKQYKELKEIYAGRKVNKQWIDMECDIRSCLYKGRIKIIKYGGIEIDGKNYNLSSGLGSHFYLDGDDINIKTVRGSIGNRLWNR